MHRQFLAFGVVFFSCSVAATGLSFWESSATNTALAAANGAIATDASVLALAPSSMTQLKTYNVAGTATHYSVSSDFQIFGEQSHYNKQNPIPSFFIATPLMPQFYFGLGIYSRTAADISVPEIGPSFFPIFYETRVSPIIVSMTPSVAYRFGALSVALSVEYMHAQYELEQNRSRFGRDNPMRWDGDADGWSGAVSMTWQPNATVNLALKHQLQSEFGDAEVAFELPSSTIAFVSWQPLQKWALHSSYTYTQSQEKGIRYQQYNDPFGLLVGAHNGHRVAFSTSYQLGNWLLKAGYSQDDAIDSQGGKDKRYRVGASYGMNKNWRLTAAWMQEFYAPKAFQHNGATLVFVQNNGSAVSLGVDYQF